MSSTDLIGAVTSFQAGRLDKERLACLFYSDERAAQIVRTNLLRSGLPLTKDFENEIRQRSVVVVFEKLLDKITKPTGFYSLWYATVQRVTLEHRNELHRHEHFETPEEETIEENRYVLELDDENARPENAVHSQLFGNRFSQALSESQRLTEIVGMYVNVAEKKKAVLPIHDTMPLVETEVGTSTLSIQHNERKQKPLSPNQQELAKIRETLGQTLREFADELGIQQERLASYLYGKTKDVPDFVISKARELLLERKDASGKLKGRFANRSMKEILDGWRDLLKNAGAPCDDARLAAFFGVTEETISNRWNENKTRPEDRRLVEYDNLVNRTVSLMKR